MPTLLTSSTVICAAVEITPERSSKACAISIERNELPPELTKSISLRENTFEYVPAAVPPTTRMRSLSK